MPGDSGPALGRSVQSRRGEQPGDGESPHQAREHGEPVDDVPRQQEMKAGRGRASRGHGRPGRGCQRSITARAVIARPSVIIWKRRRRWLFCAVDERESGQQRSRLRRPQARGRHKRPGPQDHEGGSQRDADDPHHPPPASRLEPDNLAEPAARAATTSRAGRRRPRSRHRVAAEPRLEHKLAGRPQRGEVLEPANKPPASRASRSAAPRRFDHPARRENQSRQHDE